MINIVFIAPHGTGKGTQCNFLKSKYGFKQISTGEIIRNTIQKQDSFALELKKTINSGKLVSDGVVLDLLTNYLKGLDIKDGIIFDGYPRNLNQAILLDEMLKSLNTQVDLVVYLNITKEEALKRTMGRLLCSKCNKSYNIYYDYLKPKNEGMCDECNGVLKQRDDDTEEAFNRLFEVFLNDTYPILNYYKAKNILVEIDASQTSEKIFEDIEKKLNEVLND